MGDLITAPPLTDYDWMTQALALARRAQGEGEIPVGAILVSEDNQCIGRGSNKVLQTHDPSAHAEVLAIREAAYHLQDYRLLNTTLYTTLEPCCMCAGLIVHARIKRIVFATRDVKAGAAGSIYNLLKGKPLNHQVCIDEGILQQVSAELLTDFFQMKRN